MIRASLDLLLPALVLAACSSPAPAPAPQAPAKPAAPTGPEAPFLVENARAMDRMMADMEVKPTGDVDRDFARMMIPHHQGAVDMAKALLRHGKNEELKALARSIVTNQEQEIALMRHVIGEPAPAAAGAEPAPAAEHHH